VRDNKWQQLAAGESKAQAAFLLLARSLQTGRAAAAARGTVLVL